MTWNDVTMNTQISEIFYTQTRSFAIHTHEGHGIILACYGFWTSYRLVYAISHQAAEMHITADGRSVKVPTVESWEVQHNLAPRNTKDDGRWSREYEKFRIVRSRLMYWINRMFKHIIIFMTKIFLIADSENAGFWRSMTWWGQSKYSMKHPSNHIRAV